MHTERNQKMQPIQPIIQEPSLYSERTPDSLHPLPPYFQQILAQLTDRREAYQSFTSPFTQSDVPWKSRYFKGSPNQILARGFFHLIISIHFVIYKPIAAKLQCFADHSGTPLSNFMGRSISSF